MKTGTTTSEARRVSVGMTVLFAFFRIMKTTHDIAKELLALPNVPLVIEGWCEMRGHETTVQMTGYDPEGTAIMVQKCVDEKVAAETRQWMKDHTEVVWMNIRTPDLAAGHDSVNAEVCQPEGAKKL